MLLRRFISLCSFLIASASGFRSGALITQGFGNRASYWGMASTKPTPVEMKAQAGADMPFSTEEVENVIAGLKGLNLRDDGDGANSIEWPKLKQWLETHAHKPYKEWAATATAADELADILGGPSSNTFQRMFSRVLEGGRWNSAQNAAIAKADAHRPWIVLVTGLNGIRKTTSVYEPWFKPVLREALSEQLCEADFDDISLPSGPDSFYRQLDFMVASLAVEEFKALYGANLDVSEYSARKDSIFKRYRMAAEALGILLVRAAQRERLNVMVESSGRDIGSYAYVDFLFPDAVGDGDGKTRGLGDEYHKLVVHFTVNDRSFAERSVDERMDREMTAGAVSLSGDAATAAAVNQGGPYGSAVLAGVQADSDAVWAQVSASRTTGSSTSKFPEWCKARIHIEAHEDAPWTARAVKRDGSFGEPYPFTPR